MRIKTLLLLLALAALLLALDGRSVELLRAAAWRHLPRALVWRADYRVRDPGGISSHLERFEAAALDPARPSGERLGAAELFWLATSFRGDPSRADLFEERVAVLLDVATDLAGEPAAWALVVDALRARRAVAGLADEPAEAFRAGEVLRLAARSAPENGFFELFAAEVALAAGREAEGRDALIRASRSACVDPLLRERSACAYDFLLASGLPDLEAREVLIDDASSNRGFSPGDLLEEIARQLGREDGRRVAGEPDCWLETFLAIHDAGRMLLSSTLLAEDALQALGAAAAYVDLVRAGASAGRPLVPRGESVDALAVRLAAAGFTRGAESLRETRALAGVVAARSRAGVRGGDLDGDVVLVGTTVHAELLAWAIVALGASLLALPVALRARRRALPAPSSPGVHVAAALTPFALLLYLGIRGVLPGAPPEAGRGWIDALAQPGLFVHLLPLSALAVLALPHLFVRRLRSAWSFGRGAARFFAGYAVLLLLAFAASAPLISREREARARTLATLLVDLQGGPAWPALGTGS